MNQTSSDEDLSLDPRIEDKVHRQAAETARAQRAAREREAQAEKKLDKILAVSLFAAKGYAALRPALYGAAGLALAATSGGVLPVLFGLGAAAYNGDLGYQILTTKLEDFNSSTFIGSKAKQIMHFAGSILTAGAGIGLVAAAFATGGVALGIAAGAAGFFMTVAGGKAALATGALLLLTSKIDREIGTPPPPGGTGTPTYERMMSMARNIRSEFESKLKSSPGFNDAASGKTGPDRAPERTPAAVPGGPRPPEAT